MLEVLVLGVVGLAYTCVQTLFFLNCLNSRRRERRRLERVFRDSLKTVKGAGGNEKRHSHERKEEEVSSEARNENGTTAQQVTRGDTDGEAGSNKGRLVTRLVVRSGKEAAPGSHEGVSPDPHCVRVKNAIVQLGGQCVEAEHECAPAGADSPPQQPASVCLGGDGSTLAAPVGATCTITVNNNMIQVPGDVQPLLPNNYESLEGDPMSILTQVTTLAEEGDGGRHTPPTDYTAEEDVDAPLEDLSGGDGRGHVDLLTTISQILQNPPESMDEGSDTIHLYEVPQEVPPLIVSAEAVRPSEAEFGVSEGCDEIQSSSVLPLIGHAQLDGTLPRRPRLLPPPPQPRDTWTLPRACRRVTAGHGSLPRPREKLFVTEAEGKLSRPTSPQPTSVHPAGRDETFRADGAARGTFTSQSAPAPPNATTFPLPATPRAAHSDRIASTRETVSDGENSDTEYSAPLLPDCGKEWADGEAEAEISEPDCDHRVPPQGQEPDPETALYESTEGDHPSPAMAPPLRQPEGGGEAGQAGDNIYEEITEDPPADHVEERESEGLEAQYENISESDTHADSGYESPVKADIHSSDDAASTSSAASSHDHHYEDITPSVLAEGRGRESSRRSRHQKEATDEDEEVARQRQRLQGLDDLIAGVPPPDYDRGAPLSDASARPDVCNSGSQGDIPPPAEFGDGGGNEGLGEPTSRRRLHSTLSMPPTPSHAHGRAPLSRTNSEPPPPPPPPMPSTTPSPKHSPSASHRSAEDADVPSSASSKPSSPRSAHSSVEERDDEDNLEDVAGHDHDFMRRNSQRSSNGSLGGMSAERPTSLPIDVADHYGKIMADGRDKETTASHEDLGHSPQMGKSHMMHGKSLPFIPPKFPTQPSDSGLIKPSEYLRSLGETGGTMRSPGTESKTIHNGYAHHNGTSNYHGTSHYNGTTHSNTTTHHHNDIAHHNGSSQHVSSPEDSPASIDASDSSNAISAPLPAIPESSEEETVPKENGGSAPPPPPAPPAPPASFNTLSSTRTNTLSTNHSNSNTLTHGSKTVLPTISVTDLQSVQLRKIETKTVRPTSVAIKIPVATEPMINSVKNDVIAELKMGVDIPGIKKLKSERAKEEENHIKMEKEELSRQFSASKFVDQVPDTDPAGNRIPDWKRQMLARKAAERAKKEAEEQRLMEAEEKRLQSIPPWKRQLMMKREEDSRRSVLYVPKVEDVKRIKVTPLTQDSSRTSEKSQEEEEAAKGSTRIATSSTSSSQSKVTPSSSSKSTVDTRQLEEHEEEPPNPWRTNLRKTNSKLSLLE